MATETQSQHTATVSRSMSRYHRRPSHAVPISPMPPTSSMPPMPPMPNTQDQHAATVSRSKSRYHRRPTVSQTTTATPFVPLLDSSNTTAQPDSSPSTAPRPPLPALPPPPPPTTTTPSARNRTLSSPQRVTHAVNNPLPPRPRTAKQPSGPSSPAASFVQQRSPPPPLPPPAAECEASYILQREKDRQRLLREKYEAEAAARKEARRIEVEALERLQNEEAAAAAAARLKAQQEAEQAEQAETLRRQKAEQREEQERQRKLQNARLPTRTRPQQGHTHKPRLSDKEEPTCPPSSPPQPHTTTLTADESGQPFTLGLHDREVDTIRCGGRGAVLGIDAPVSAVNADDRRVTVVCGTKRIQLPVTPATTPLDLIKSAATILTEPVDVRTSAVSELFTRVSITRPLRNYECVRDVLNSWDYDAQNELLLLDTHLDGIEQDDLLAYKVPDTRPDGMSCFIHYSSKPGKWAKRYLTLRPDGHLVMAKSDKARDKDTENICTLTDYDIYTVTQQKLARVKPPKKICYAIKSMQKSNIFADESQYVHFFCTNDRPTATALYKSVQSWRSWYLKHHKADGLRKKAAAGREAGHTRGESVGSHYQLGAFSSLLDMDDFNKKLDSIEVHKPGEFPDDKPLSRLDTRIMHARNKSLRVKHSPPVAFHRSPLGAESDAQPASRQGSRRPSMNEANEETFAAAGLLGRTYTHRQAVAAQNREREQQQPAPFTEGPSLLNNMGRAGTTDANDSGLKRNSSMRSVRRRSSGEAQRSGSRRVPGMPEPLLDLTPQYRPPPQHANRGKAFVPGASGGLLVESATSMEEAIKVPPATDWRARAPQGRAGHGAYELARSLKGRGEPLAGHTCNNHSGAPEDDSHAFTGGGLLSQAGPSQGHALVGRGVMDGSKARRPMVSLDDGKPFAPGSLLSAVPASSGPVVDRTGR